MKLSKEQQDDVPQCDPDVVAYIREQADKLLRWPAPLNQSSFDVADALYSIAVELESGSWRVPEAPVIFTYEEEP